LELTLVEGLRTLRLDLVATLALAALSLFAGGWLARRVRPLGRASIPAAAVGGLLFALAVMLLRWRGTLGVGLDTSLRAPLQIAFFTTIGFGATARLLRAGGARMILFFVLASLTAVMQNLAGLGLARALGAPDALGVICGSLTLTGGPATGLAWAERFESLGVAGAGALIIASATFGIFVSSLVGNPAAVALIRRFGLAPRRGEAGRADAAAAGRDAETKRDLDEEQFWAIGATAVADEEVTRDEGGGLDAGEGGGRVASEAGRGAAPFETGADAAHVAVGGGREADGGGGGPGLSGAVLLRNLLIVLVVMGVGALLGAGLARLGVTLPAYVGAMICAALVRNADERARWFRLDVRAVEAIGGVALALFLVIALMDLKLWQLAGLAVPMLVILAAQVLLTVLYSALVVFTLMGRDYEAAVTTSGHVGFGLGITPNAVANMEALAARYGPAPRSFLYVPVVGAFFIDFTNALVITAFFNFLA
jgi:glutamate:Na+ symporter, ESS family